jgi:hypothetical protein
MKAATLPAWARAALDTLAPVPAWGAARPNAAALRRHDDLTGRLRQAWPALRAHLLPELDALADDAARTRALRIILDAAKYGTPTYNRARRDAQRAADELGAAIAAKADELVRLMQRRATLTKRGDIADEAPDALDIVQAWHEAAQGRLEHAAWAHVVGSPLRRFLVVARSTSRPGPELAELVAAIAQRARPAQPPGPRASSRKSTADHRRALLAALARALPASVRFSDATIADVLTVLFGDDTSADAVRKLRARR